MAVDGRERERRGGGGGVGFGVMDMGRDCVKPVLKGSRKKKHQTYRTKHRRETEKRACILPDWYEPLTPGTCPGKEGLSTCDGNDTERGQDYFDDPIGVNNLCRSQIEKTKHVCDFCY